MTRMGILVLGLAFFLRGAAGKESLPRRFEARVRYQDRSGKDQPLPIGTRVGVTQIYRRLEGRAFTMVEDEIGQNRVVDREGTVSIPIRPYGPPPYRFRVVAKAILQGTDHVPPISAVFMGRYAIPFLLISGAIPVTAEDVHKGAFTAARPIVLEFHSNYANPPTKGIPITHEGVLSPKRGHIPAGPGEEIAPGVPTSVAGAMRQGRAYRTIGASPGIWRRQNHGGAISILRSLGLGYDFSLRARSLFEVFPPPHRPPEVPRIAACWFPYSEMPIAELKGKDTAFAYVRGVPRVVVRGGAKNPDEEDAHVILRAYATFFRLRYLQSSKKELENPPVEYPLLTSPSKTIKAAWEQGWDHFLPCAILRKPDWVDGDLRGQAVREYRLEKMLEEIVDALKKDSPDLSTRFRNMRGLRSGYAWALLFWRLFRRYDMDFVNRLLLHARDKKASSYMGIERLLELYPEEGEVFEALGLVPRPLMKSEPEGATVLATYPSFLWSANGLWSVSKQVRYTLEIAEGTPSQVVHRVEGLEKTSFDFRKIQGAKEVEQKAGISFVSGRTYFWRVVAEVASRKPQGAEGKPGKESGKKTKDVYLAPSRTIAFRLDLPRKEVTWTGDDVNEGRARMHIPRGTVKEGKTMSIRAWSVSLAPGTTPQPVIGGKAYEFNTGGTTSGTTFEKPVKLTIEYDPSDLKGRDPNPNSPGIDSDRLGIYTLERSTSTSPPGGRWVYVGGEVDTKKREVSVWRDHTSLYALMADIHPPRLSELSDGPDPARTREPVTLRFSLDEPSQVSVFVVTDRVVKTLARDKRLAAGRHEFVWDGSGDDGKPVAAGTYWWTVQAKDRVGQEARVTGGRITRTDAARGAVTGRLGIRAARFRAEVLDTTLATRNLDSNGSYRIPGAVEGRYTIRLSAEGFLPRRLEAVVIPSSGNFDLGATPLSKSGLRFVSPPPARFRPAKEAAWTVKVELEVPGTLELEVRDSAGESAGSFSPSERSGKGFYALHWKGVDSVGTALENGFYTIRLWILPDDGLAGNRVLQGEFKALLDRGLLRDSGVYPKVFAPTGDGFEDEVSVEARITHEGTLRAEVVDAGGARRRLLAAGRKLSPGPLALKWDGKDDRGSMLPDGRYTIRLAPVYPGGIASREETHPVLLDRTPPRLGEISPPNGTVVETGMPRLRCRLLSDPTDVSPSTIKVKIDEVTTDPDSYDPKTGWIEFTPKTSLGTRGVHIAIFYAQDPVGNYAAPVATAFTVKLRDPDRTAPSIEILSPKEGDIVYGESYAITARVTDRESGINPDAIVLRVNGRKVASKVRFLIPGKSGKAWDMWQYEKAVILYNPLTGLLRYNSPVPLPGEPPIPDGRYRFDLEVEDHAGRAAKSNIMSFKLVPDSHAPKVVSIAPKNGALLDHGKPRIHVRFEERGESGLDWGSLRFLVDGRSIEQGAIRLDDDKSGFSWNPAQALEDNRDHVVMVDIRDRARNRSETATSVFSVRRDREAPGVVWIAPKMGERFPAGAVRIQALVYDGGRPLRKPFEIDLELDGAAAPWAYDEKKGLLTATFSSLRAGRHLLRLRVADGSGNRSPAEEVPFWVVEDLEAPRVALGSPAGTRLEIRAEDPGGVDWGSAEAWVGGRRVPIQAPKSGPSARILLTGLEKGEHVLVFRVSDRAGNRSDPAILVFRVP